MAGESRIDFSGTNLHPTGSNVVSVEPYHEATTLSSGEVHFIYADAALVGFRDRDRVEFGTWFKTLNLQGEVKPVQEMRTGGGFLTFATVVSPEQTCIAFRKTVGKIVYVDVRAPGREAMLTGVVCDAAAGSEETLKDNIDRIGVKY
jgi:hypothetical protein